MTKKTKSAKSAKGKSRSKRGVNYARFIKFIKKRDGRVADFDFERISNAIYKAMLASSEGSQEEAEMVAHRVASEIVRDVKKHKGLVPTVEAIQDEVERQLILSNYADTAKAYILYRAKRAEERKKNKEVPEHIKNLAKEASKYFKGDKFGEFVYLRTYARWIEGEGRRETWPETVQRYMDFMREKLGDKLTESEYKKVHKFILDQKVMPSMRLMQFAGPAARRCNVVAYNCSYIAPEKIEDFAEAMYLSMSGSGVGFSVESQHAQKLPIVKKQSGDKLPTHVVGDSKEGWGDALTAGLKAWWNGQDIDFDFSQVRPYGARLKTMGGKSSGPEPLRELLQFAREKILSRQGKRLRNVDVHDIMCKIAEIVVAGGVRRSAMISLSDLDDIDMRDAKKGAFYNTNPQRMMANNSAVYEDKPSAAEFLKEWTALIESGSGERGIFNRGSLYKTLPERRIKYLEEKYGKGNLGPLGTNPCGEVILQPKQFCNLTEIIARPDDTEKTLLEKARIATILGTYQASLDDFKYISKQWKKNIQDERLLGVSITGQWDCPAVRDEKVLRRLRDEVIKTNKKYAKRFGINPTTAATSVKPSGTVSKTFNSSSGMHPRYAKYYVQRIRISAHDALFQMLKDQGVPYHPEVGQDPETANTYVVEFPIKAPEGAIVNDDLSAIDMLEHWKKVKLNYTEHNPSITISVGEDEWVEVANWVYENWDIVGGLSFLPRSDFVYKLAPMEKIDKETYDKLYERVKHIDFSKLVLYEKEDETDVKQEAACAGGTCEIEI